MELETPADPRATRQAWWAFVVLNVAVLFAFVDRQIIALLVDPIRSELHIDDTRIGLLQGPAFALFYAGAALPLGWLIDRANRRAVLVGGVVVWTCATAACGFASDFGTLFAARMAVGAGEACLVPGFFSLMGDHFKPRQRAIAFGAYMAIMLCGSSLSMSLCGLLVDALTANPVQLFGLSAPWRLAFVAAAAPGPIVALALMTMVEPRRQAAGRPPGEAAGFFRSNWALLAALVFGFTALGSLFQTALAWFPSVLVRGHGWRAGEAGTAIGLVVAGVALAAGGLAALIPRGLSRAGRFPTTVSVAAAAALLGAVAGLFWLAPTALGALLGAAGVLLPVLVGYGLGPMVLQSIVPPAVWGRMSAIVKLHEALLVALVATLAGVLSDRVFPGPDGLAAALAVITAALLLPAAAAFMFARRRFEGLLATKISADRDPAGARPAPARP